MSNTDVKLICVIGSGASGLTAVKECIDQQLNVICYEKTDNLGGLWRYRDEDIDGVPSIAKTTTANSSKEMSAFSDFPPPEHFPNYMNHRYMLKYLEYYANHFDVTSKIMFNHEVISATFNDDYDESGKWKVTVRNTVSEAVTENIFDGVMVCSGHHVKPIIPTFTDQEQFKGRILHTHSYKTWHEFEDKVVVVVGVGNSGSDVAVELSRVCSKVYLACRTGSWIFNRVSRRGTPLDLLFGSRALKTIADRLPYNWVCNFFERFLNSYFDHELYGLKPKHRVLSQHTTLNDLIANCIVTGAVIVRKNIERFTTDGVMFEGNSEEIKCDVVVLATGYEVNFPFIDSSIISVHKNEVQLFKNVFQPNVKHCQTFATIGLVDALGAVFPIAELQSRWAAMVMSGKLKLPSKCEMVKTIEMDTTMRQLQYYDAPRNALQVDNIGYSDEIAKMIGAMPDLVQLAITDPTLWYKVYLGPCVAYQYRLQGPGKWSGARKAIMDIEKRFKVPFQTTD